MAEQTVDALVDAGKASAGPPLGPALGPTGLNIGAVIAEINKATAGFAGMSVPIKVIFDPSKKTFRIEVGTPPVSQLVIKELGVKKGSSNPSTDKIGNLAVEQLIKIAKMKMDKMLSHDLKNAIKEVVGTCFSMGVLIEGEEPKDALIMINEGTFDEAIKSERTTISAEKQAELAEDLKEAREEIAEEQAEQAAEEAEETGEAPAGETVEEKSAEESAE